MMMRVRITIRGIVQGIGYLEEIRRRALELGLSGITRNLPDGAVEVIAEGEHDRLREFVTSLRSAEPPLQVNALMADYQESKGCFADFLVVRDAEHNNEMDELTKDIKEIKQLFKVFVEHYLAREKGGEPA